MKVNVYLHEEKKIVDIPNGVTITLSGGEAMVLHALINKIDLPNRATADVTVFLTELRDKLSIFTPYYTSCVINDPYPYQTLKINNYNKNLPRLIT